MKKRGQVGTIVAIFAVVFLLAFLAIFLMNKAMTNSSPQFSPEEEVEINVSLLVYTSTYSVGTILPEDVRKNCSEIYGNPGLTLTTDKGVYLGNLTFDILNTEIQKNSTKLIVPGNTTRVIYKFFNDCCLNWNGSLCVNGTIDLFVYNTSIKGIIYERNESNSNPNKERKGLFAGGDSFSDNYLGIPETIGGSCPNLGDPSKPTTLHNQLAYITPGNYVEPRWLCYNGRWYVSTRPLAGDWDSWIYNDLNTPGFAANYEDSAKVDWGIIVSKPTDTIGNWRIVDDSSWTKKWEQIITPSCGNGSVDTSLGEVCDDGNILNGDGCSSSCLIERPSTSNLVAWYKFENNLNDELGQNNGIFLSSSFVNGIFGKGILTFNDTDVFIDDSPSLHLDKEVTISLWIYQNSFAPTELNNWSKILWKGNLLPDGSLRCTYNQTGDDANWCSNREWALYSNSYQYVYASSTPTNRISFGEVGASSALGTLSERNWHYLTFMISTEKDYLQLYIDGNLKINRTYLIAGSPSTIRDTLGPLYLGSSYLTIDELKIYNKTLSESEITKIYDDEKPRAPITSNLVAHYKFESSTNNIALDELGINNGTLRNGASIINDPEMGKVLSLDGNDDFIFVPNSNSLNLNVKNFTISAWVKTTDNDSYNVLLTKEYPASNWTGYGIWINNHSLTSEIIDDGAFDWQKTRYGRTITSNIKNVTDNQWHLITMVSNGTEIVSYVDGVNVFSSSVNAYGPLSNYSNVDNISSTAPLIIGHRGYNLSGADPWKYYLKGLVDDVRVYNSALSDENISQIYEETRLNGVPKGLISWYRFENNTLDSALSNNGTVEGAINYSNGKIGNALLLDGVNSTRYDGDRVSVDIPQIQNDSGTISVWAYPLGAGINRYVLSSRHNNRTYIQFIKDSKSDKVQIVKGNPSSESILFQPLTANLNKWYQITLSWRYNGSAYLMKGYLNGLPNSEGEKEFAQSARSANFLIGAQAGRNTWLNTSCCGDGDNSTAEFNGLIDEVMFFNRTLNDTEVKEIYYSQQNQLCGDRICQADKGEVCDVCVSDCGTCPAPPISPPNGGNPGGSSSCYPNWSCQWGPCVSNEKRWICIDSRRCNTNRNKPQKADESCSVNSDCLDNDRDGYGVGTDCLGIDLNDNDNSITNQEIIDLTNNDNTSGQTRDVLEGKIIYIILGVLTGLIIIVLFFIFLIRMSKHKRNTNKNTIDSRFKQYGENKLLLDKTVHEEKIKRAKEFLVNARNKGYNEDQVRKMFINKGWPQAAIKEIFE